MRHLASLCLVAAAGLAACTTAPQVASTPPTTAYNPPTVTYQLTTNDLTEANAKAASYCTRYSATPRLMSAVGGHATYQCVGGSAGVPTAAPATATVPPGTVVTTPPAVATVPSPTVSYPVIGNDVSSANISAANYCRQYGRAAQLNNVTSGTAYYTCY